MAPLGVYIVQHWEVFLSRTRHISVFNDIERLVLAHAPRLKGEYEAMKVMLDDYKQVYSNTLPLLMTQGKRGGMEYYLPNEDLLRNVLPEAVASDHRPLVVRLRRATP